MGGISGDLIPQCEAKKNREERWQMGTSVWTNLVLEEDGNIEITGQFAVEYSLVRVSQLHTDVGNGINGGDPISYGYVRVRDDHVGGGVGHKAGAN